MAKIVRGTISPEQFQGPLRQGTSPVMMMAKGSFVMGNVLSTDAEGNAIDSGGIAEIITISFKVNGAEICRVVPKLVTRVRR